MMITLRGSVWIVSPVLMCSTKDNVDWSIGLPLRSSLRCSQQIKIDALRVVKVDLDPLVVAHVAGILIIGITGNAYLAVGRLSQPVYCGGLTAAGASGNTYDEHERSF